jgi:hypothetical protein
VTKCSAHDVFHPRPTQLVRRAHGAFPEATWSHAGPDCVPPTQVHTLGRGGGRWPESVLGLALPVTTAPALETSLQDSHHSEALTGK